MERDEFMVRRWHMGVDFHGEFPWHEGVDLCARHRVRFFLLDLSFYQPRMNSSGLTFRVFLPAEGHCHLRVRILGHCRQNSGTLSLESDVTFFT